MAHFPINHPARPLYRVISGLVGLYIFIFGIVGIFATWGEAPFAHNPTRALGLRTNLAFAIISVIFGLFLLIGASRRSNLGHYMNLTAGVVFLFTSVLMMAVLRTPANFLNFSMSTVIVSMIFGLILLATGLYDKVGPTDQADEVNGHRHRPEPVPERRR